MLKKIISYILTFAIVFLLIIVMGLTILKFTVLNEKYTLSMLEKNNYCEKINAHIQETFRDYILQSGLGEEVLDNLYDEEKLKSDLQIVVHGLYNGEKYKIDVTPIQENLQNKINEIMKGNNKTPNSEEKKSIEKFIKSITNTYSGEIEYSNGIVSNVGKVISMLNPIINIVIIVSAVLSVVMLAVLIALNKNLKYVAIVLIATGGMYVILNLLTHNYIKINNILFLNAVFSNFIIYFLNSILNIIMIAGVIFVISGIIFSLLKNRN